jgi:hypothetical protein
MAATRKSEGALVAGTGTSLSVPVPALATGDYQVMWLLQGASETPPTISGWTLAYSEPNQAGGVGCIYYRVAGSSASATNQAVTVVAGGAAAKVSVWSGAGTDAPVVTTRVVETTATFNETPALNLPNPRGVLVFGFINAVRTAGAVSTNGTITATATARAFESILGAYQLSTYTADVTSAAGGTIRRAFSGGGTTAWTFAVVIPSAPPAAPTGLEVTGGTREFGVTFDSVSGADSYEIRRRRTDRTPPSPTNQPSPPWSLVQVNADEWTDDGTGAVVYVIDTGIRATHDEFTGVTVTGWNRPGLSGDWDTDTYGHGTEVASAAVGATRGVAKGADLHVVRIGADASVMPPLLSWFEDAVDEVLTHHATSGKAGVVNYSAPLPGDPFEGGDGGDFAAAVAKVEELLEAGIHVVMAEGNSAALETQMPPELHGKVLMVGGTTSAGVFWDDGGGAGSNYSPSTNILAPAKEVPVAYNTGDSNYGTDTGTSFAAPMVAGAVAKIIGANPHLSPERVIEVLRSQATTIPTGQPTGYAIPLLNAAATTADWFTRNVGTSTSITDTGFGDEETYEYAARTHDEGATSAWSVSDSATTDPAPEEPTGPTLKARIDGSTVAFTGIAVRINGETVPVTGMAIRQGGVTVPLV